METILFLAHTEPDGSLARAAQEALPAALGLGCELVVGLVGRTTEAAANQIASCSGDVFRFRNAALD